MKKLDKTEVVIFRVWPDGGVIALWPHYYYYLTSYPYCRSYEHIGQHGAADYDLVLTRTRPAKQSEYADLLEELRSLGHNPVIRQRRLGR